MILAKLRDADFFPLTIYVDHVLPIFTALAWMSQGWVSGWMGG